jgi:hypothetical protein
MKKQPPDPNLPFKTVFVSLQSCQSVDALWLLALQLPNKSFSEIGFFFKVLEQPTEVQQFPELRAGRLKVQQFS